MGVVRALVAFVQAIWIVLKAMLLVDPVAGWPTMMSVSLFPGGVQLVALGMIGEHPGRPHEESKQRPVILVDCWQPAGGVDSNPSSILQGAGHAHGASTSGHEIA